MEYQKASIDCLPEGTDWNTKFQFSEDGRYWTSPMRCKTVYKENPKCEAENGIRYNFMRPSMKWIPSTGETYAFWDKDSEYYMVTILEAYNEKGFIAKRWADYFDHIACIDTLTKVPTSVDELKQLVGEENWL